MAKVYLKQPASLILPHPEDAEARARLKEGLPRSAQRRMTLNGLMVHRVLEGRDLAAVPAILYLTAFAESRTMESYLRSFPTPSPMGFQASIHPSAVEQSLIARQQPVPCLLPLGGLDALFPALRMAAGLRPGSLLVAAEEMCPWLAGHGLSSDDTFAWAVTLASEDEAEAVLEWDAATPVGSARGRYSGLADSFARRIPWECQRPEWGRVRLSWK